MCQGVTDNGQEARGRAEGKHFAEHRTQRENVIGRKTVLAVMTHLHGSLTNNATVIRYSREQ